MVVLLLTIFFVFGLIIGSFLNVVIYRLNTSRSLGGRSACMSCQHKLSWYELIPLFSYLGLGGRCRNCKTKISSQYILVELVTGLIFGVLFLKFQEVLFLSPLAFTVTYLYYVTAFSLLLIIAVYDIKHKIIPDKLVLIFGILAFIGLFFFTSNDFSYIYNFNLHVPTLWDFLSGIFVASPFAIFWLISGGRWMGLGDAKLALGIGWLLGVSIALSSLAIAFWSGAIIGVTLIILFKNSKTRRLQMKSEIPFAPFLVLGVFLAFIFDLKLFGF